MSKQGFRIVVIFFLIMFVLGFFSEKSSADTVYNFTFHNYTGDSKVQTPAEKGEAQQITVPLAPGVTPTNIVAATSPEVKKEESFNSWRLFFGMEEQHFKGVESIQSYHSTYSESKTKQTNYLVGINIPIGQRLAIKPSYVFGSHVMTATETFNSYYDSYERTVDSEKGHTQGLGLDVETNLFKSRFDVRLGASYRYLRNTGGILDNLAGYDYKKVQQDLQTLALYISPTITYQFINLSLNAGVGTILDEKLRLKSGGGPAYSYSNRTDHLFKKSFVQYGASVAFNF